MTPEALDSLSKQELIALILAQQEQIRQLMARVAELEARLNLPPKTPSNSSLPPSKGQKASQPEKAKKLRKGRPGVARKLAQNPDCIRDEFVAVCLECGKAASLSDQLDEAGRAVMSLIAGAYQGAVRNTQSFLAVGHDAGHGRLRLERDKLIVDWPHAAQDPVFKRSEDAFMRATAATGGTYIKNPLSVRLMGGNPLTVHPLGGCPMGADRHTGVVNQRGQVFDAAARTASESVHDGLYVCDGAVVPRSLGIHPLLTIAALAERAMIHLAGDRKWKMAL